MKPEKQEVYYRYRYRTHIGSDPEKLPHVTITFDEFRVLKRTPAGAWIWDHLNHQKRFINDSARKRWAHRDPEHAWISFKRRKEVQFSIMRAQYEAICQVINAVNKRLTDPPVSITHPTKGE
jgi:hypothetical protein